MGKSRLTEPDFQINLFPGERDGDRLCFERALWSQGHRYVAGIDEAGRGPLAGPVVAAAVVLGPDADLPGVADSKTLTKERREIQLPLILGQALAVSAAAVWHGEIDRVNILEATRAAMLQSVSTLCVSPTHLLIDGNQKLRTRMPQTTLIKGDARCLSISAASIVAKVVRDWIMDAMHLCWPMYCFDTNRGYGTRAHFKALETHGPCPIHRFTFRPVCDLVREPEKK